MKLTGRDKPSEMQLAAAKVLTYLHRAGVIPASEPVINRRVGPFKNFVLSILIAYSLFPKVYHLFLIQPCVAADELFLLMLN